MDQFSVIAIFMLLTLDMLVEIECLEWSSQLASDSWVVEAKWKPI